MHPTRSCVAFLPVFPPCSMFSAHPPSNVHSQSARVDHTSPTRQDKTTTMQCSRCVHNGSGNLALVQRSTCPACGSSYAPRPHIRPTWQSGIRMRCNCGSGSLNLAMHAPTCPARGDSYAPRPHGFERGIQLPYAAPIAPMAPTVTIATVAPRAPVAPIVHPRSPPVGVGMRPAFVRACLDLAGVRSWTFDEVAAAC